MVPILSETRARGSFVELFHPPENIVIKEKNECSSCYANASTRKRR